MRTEPRLELGFAKPTANEALTAGGALKPRCAESTHCLPPEQSSCLATAIITGDGRTRKSARRTRIFWQFGVAFGVTSGNER
jgi:hypothetical protein